MDEKEFTLPVGEEEELSCVVTEADSDNAAILVHGFHGHKNVSQFTDAAHFLAEEEYTVIRFDMRGCGDSSRSFQEQTLTTQVEDLETVHTYVKDRFDTVAVIGSSLGGFITLQSQVPASAYVLWAPALKLKELMEEHHGLDWDDVLEQETVTLPHPTRDETVDVNAAYLEEVRRVNPAAVIQDTDTPVLAVHGTEDASVPHEHTVDLFDRFPGRRELVLLAANHFLQPHMGRALSETLTWLNQWCRGDAA